MSGTKHVPPRKSKCLWSVHMMCPLTVPRLLPLQQRRGVLIMIMRRAISRWDGPTLLYLTHGTGQRNSLTPLSSSLWVTNGKALYLEKCNYVCSHQASGGEVPYQKKHPDWQCKIGSKKSGCACQIMIKCYHHTEMILGQYAEEHNHKLGVENIAYTWLLREAQEQIRSMLHRRVDPWEIVRNHYLFSTWSNLSVG